MSQSTTHPGEVREAGFLERLIAGGLGPAATALLFALSAASIALALFHLHAAVFGAPEGRSFRSTHLTVMLTLAIAMKPLFRPSMLAPVHVPGSPGTTGLRALGLTVDVVIVAMVLLVQWWTMRDIDGFQLRLGSRDATDQIMGVILIGVVLEATRRAVGWAMVIITAFFMTHALYAQHFPGFFYGPPVRFGKFIDAQFMSTDGLFGIPLHVAATTSSSSSCSARCSCAPAPASSSSTSPWR